VSLQDLFEETARCHPERSALCDAAQGGAGLGYAELARCVAGLSARIARRFAPGDRVGLLAPNGVEFVVAYLALTRMGAVAVPLDDRLRPGELARLLDVADPQALLFESGLAGAASSAVEQARCEVEAIELAALSESGAAAPPAAWRARGEDVAELIFTSGTTGRPKAAMRSHANVRAALRNAESAFCYRPSDTILVAMPLSHSSALTSQLLPILEVGGRAVLLERFEAASFVTALSRHRVTCMRAVPAMLRMLLGLERFCEEQLPALRCISNSSAPIDEKTWHALRERFPGVEILNSYGLTEASTCTVLSHQQGALRPDSIGVPLDGVELEVRDEAGACLGAGEEGELWVRGPHVFTGYFGDPPASAAARRDGWFRTGDLAHRDSAGFYRITGRRDQLINCGGHKVAPAEVEACIRGLSKVRDVSVVGRPHRSAGEVVLAYVVVAPGSAMHKREVTQHCRRHLASHKIPFHVEFVPDLPRNALGKVLKKELRET